MPWFAFDIDAYDADTMHLTAAEDGIYSRLLRHYYRTRMPLPDNDRALAAIARVSVDEWEPVKATIRAFFKARGGLLHHKRCDEELDKEDKLAKKRSVRAENAARKRWNGTNRLDATSMPEACDEHSRGMPDACSTDAQAMLGDATRPDQTESPHSPPLTDRGRDSAGDPAAANGAKRGSRLPRDWRPNEQDRAFALQLGLDADEVGEEFRDYWASVPGSKGVKLDWSATFRNRCREIAKRRDVRPPPSQGRALL